ncbi:GNAT family N-acetyltransferase [Teredinibacter haidensis]|uniref:GNAT family N-acetyltransferase n=1 Tax=Teredinibacter haidensis TaxID=2731755 RepID=UPI00094906D0|nr:N-acetyltransferase [Teredinibacter haidensis]
MSSSIEIKEMSPTEIEFALEVEKAAFASESEAQLCKDLFQDSSAEPYLSLLAFDQKLAVGHILFTKATLATLPQKNFRLLAPLAVIPSHQKQGIGLQLVRKGLDILRQQRVEWVFVLGHITYYPKAGFFPAYQISVDPPYPIAEEVRDAWMVHTLGNDIQQHHSARLACCRAFDKPEHWRE